MSRKQRELDMLSSFNEITGAPMDSCRFFLESSNWNLELALSRFYNPDEHEQGDFSRQDVEGAWNQNVDLDPTVGQTVGGGGGTGVSEETIEELEDDMDIEETWGPKVGASKLNDHQNPNTGDDTVASGANSESEEKRKKGDKKAVVASPASTTNPKSSSRIGSMSTLRAHESSSEEEEGQVYYAGGSEHSGQQVVGPSRGSHDIISEIFHSLRDEGRVEAITSRPSAPQIFSGQGYRLGQSTDDTPLLSAAVGAGGDASSRSDSKPSVVLRFWQNGFSINDGPLRSYDDPKERMFLAGISKGNVPSELYCQADKGGAVHLTLQDRRHENYIAPLNKPVPFTGQGHVLGRTETIKSYHSAAQPEQSSPKDDKETAKKGVTEKTLLNVNPNKAVTTVQVRLPDGERLQIKLNHTHTIADLRMAVVEMRPELSNQLFTLVALYPRRELSDDNFTLIQADLLNSSILLRL